MVQTNEKLNQSKKSSNITSTMGHLSKRRLIGAIDQGTSSTRFLVFENGSGRLLESSQIEIKRIVPKEGWVEIDPNSIMDSVYSTIACVHHKMTSTKDDDINNCSKSPLENHPFKLDCIGICNQRESAVVWDSQTGKALYNVIVWMDSRTRDLVDAMIDSLPGRNSNWLKDKTGLPMSTYFSAFKLRWLIDNVEEVKVALKEKRLMFGTVDSWILWNLTGNHLTDVTNASRTYLMDIETLNWDKSLCKLFGIPMNILPTILASADDFGKIQHGPFKGTPVTGVIGDQSAALFGHNCLQVGQTKATFGTGCFIMQNIGPGPLSGALSGLQREAKQGLITTVGYKLRDRPASYALEGSIKIAGAALTWLRDNLQLIESYEECDQLINKTTNSAGVFFVPALGGLYSPYWDPNASGLFIGLSQFTRREHLVRATFDAIAFQTNDILSLMRGVTNGLTIDGGLCKSDNMCQILADITACDIVRPSMCETSALGAAMLAGYGAGIWSYESMLENSSTPYESSLNQTHHYPHESLHYEEKFSSLIQSKSFMPQKSQSTQRQVHPKRQQARLSSLPNNITAGDGSMSPILASMCKLDGGGDDGGGHSYAGAYDDDDDDTSSSSRLVSSDTDCEQATLNLEEYNAVKPNGDGSNPMNLLAIGTTNNAFIGVNGLTEQKLRYHMAPSSGYSSGDNFELATIIDSDQRLRRDSPICPSRATGSIINDQVLEVNELEEVQENSLHEHMRNINGIVDNDVNACVDNKSSSFLMNGSSSYFCPSSSESPAAIRQDVASTDTDSADYAEDRSESTTSFEEGDDEETGSMIGTCDKDTKDNTLQIDADQIRHKVQSRLITKPSDVFQMYISLEHRSELVETWTQAVGRSMQWTIVHHEEARRIDYQRLATLPLSMYLFLSLGTVVLSGLISNSRLMN